MNINARNILTMQLSLLSLTIDLTHFAVLVYLSTVQNKQRLLLKSGRQFLPTGPLTRPDGGQREGISGSREILLVAPIAGARGLNLFDWNVQLRERTHTHTYVCTCVSSHS